MNVHSIFQTIQGEGPFSGSPAIFVRFAGCNLRCFFCDTDFDAGTIHTPEALAQKVANLQASIPRGNCYRLVLTGGEPMLQPLFDFIMFLNSFTNMPVDIETAGTVWPDRLTNVLERVQIVCSPKTSNVHPEIKYRANAWKYIIRAGETDPKDGLPNKATQLGIIDQRIYRPAILSPDQIFVQPCDEGDVDKNKRNVDEAVHSAMRFGYRLSLQVHKLVGLP
jgi:organic radical activating enzyme